jgi:hypothetical protein
MEAGQIAQRGTKVTSPVAGAMVIETLLSARVETPISPNSAARAPTISFG